MDTDSHKVFIAFRPPCHTVGYLCYTCLDLYPLDDKIMATSQVVVLSFPIKLPRKLNKDVLLPSAAHNIFISLVPCRFFFFIYLFFLFFLYVQTKGKYVFSLSVSLLYVSVSEYPLIGLCVGTPSANCKKSAANICTPSILRNTMYIYIFFFGGPTPPITLWDIVGDFCDNFRPFV